MAPVLLTLLDEQLNGTIADEASRIGAREGELSSPNRIAARYAEDDRVFRADLPASAPALPHGQTYPHIAQPVHSPDLQFFLQRFLMGNTRDLQAGAAGPHGPGPGRDRKGAADPASGASVVKVAGIAVGVGAILILVAVKFFG